MSFCWLIECRCDNLSLDAARHVRNLLRTLVDKEYDHVNLRMIVGDCVGNRLQEHGLTCLRLRNDESALTLSDRCEHVHDTARHVVVTVTKEIELLVWEKWSQEVERNPVSDELWSAAVDVLDLYKREVLVSSLRGSDFTCHSVTSLERMLLDLVLRDVNIIR